jgi:hypothetical protein
VALLKDMSFEARMRDIRSCGRLNSRVAVAIEWADTGQSLRAEGYTIDIGPRGCLAVVPQGFAVGQKLHLVNLTSQISCEAVLVWRGHEGRTGWKLGLELLQPSRIFGASILNLPTYKSQLSVPHGPPVFHCWPR